MKPLMSNYIWDIHAGINGLVQLLFLLGFYKQVKASK